MSYILTSMLGEFVIILLALASWATYHAEGYALLILFLPQVFMYKAFAAAYRLYRSEKEDESRWRT